MSSVKKARASNFFQDEKTLLMKFVNKYKSVIENKKTDGTTWKAKEECWAKIEKQWATCSGGPARTATQLRMKYDGIKKDIKKKYSSHKLYMRGTGGGKPLPEPTPSTEEEKELTETIILSVQGLKTQFDNDADSNDDDGVSPDEVNIRKGTEGRAESIEIREVNCDWSNFGVDMLQTPRHAVLSQSSQQVQWPAEEGTEQEGINDFVENVETVEPAGMLNPLGGVAEQQKENNNKENKKPWSNRRRPLLNKKKSHSSAAAKFETLAERKSLLINEVTKQYDEQTKQNQEEHALRKLVLEEQKKNEDLKSILLKYKIKISKLSMLN